MRTLFLILIQALFICSLSYSQKGWTDQTRVLPDTLRKLPVGITIYHSPNPNYPELNEDDRSKGNYVWKHSTYVRAENEDLEVIAAGSFIWYSAEGWFANIQYSKEEFAERFDCKNGILKKGKLYCFKKNYRYGNQLYGGDALWFVLAKDKNGTIYKGIGLLETESELLKTTKNN